MHANVEDRGIKGECTPLMEAASAGHLDIVRLLVAHGADVNAQSSSGRNCVFIDDNYCIFPSNAQHQYFIKLEDLKNC